MCERCAEIDLRLAHYRELSTWLLDKLALDGIQSLIARYETEKKALHPERAK